MKKTFLFCYCFLILVLSSCFSHKKDLNGRNSRTYSPRTIFFFLPKKDGQITFLGKFFYQSRIRIVQYKPIVYVYPEKTDTISLTLKPSGNFTVTYPEYQNGWRVQAEPDGKLTSLESHKEYYGLYWEGETTESFTFNRKVGFVVNAEQTAAFMDSILTVSGLNYRERNEFIIFWLPQLKQHPWNYFHFLQGENYNQVAELTVEPKPQTLIRLYMLCEPLDNPETVITQKLIPYERKGFTVVEWGGSILKPSYRNP